ncbi:MAG TPA: RecX family transcriptional regulator [Gaiellaceae bacterium]|nr:RecX family transcriptional regulator [Gaiellaceae bacterium]
MLEPSAHALDAAVRALSRRELSRAELILRLARSGIDATDAERASAKLAQAGFQSDERTACERARVLAARLYGDLAIRADLARRGIAEADIEAAIAGVTPEATRATALAARAASPTKLSHMLRRRGYAEDTIEQAMGGALRFEASQG